MSLAIAASLLAPSPAISAEDDDSSRRSKNAWSRSSEKPEEDEWSGAEWEIDARTAKKLTNAREATVAENYEEAESILDGIRESSLNPLEQAQVFRLRAYIAYGREDFDAARSAFEKCIAQNALSRSDVADIRFQIAQLWFAEENWKEGAKNLELWFEIEDKPNAASHYLLALAYYQLEDFDKALPRALRAVEETDEPRESWLQLLLAIRLTKQQYEESVPILEQLVERFPKKTYWLSLSTVHGSLGHYEEALIPLQLAYTQGMLTTGAELKRLAQLMLFLDLPIRAAQVLEDGLKSGSIPEDPSAWELLGNSLISARNYEEAAKPLARAAELSEDGELYVRLALVHIQRERWKEASSALQRALEKGLEKPGQALLLMGITLHSQEQPQQARRWFARARSHEDTHDEAQTWIQYIDRQQTSG